MVAQTFNARTLEAVVEAEAGRFLSSRQKERKEGRKEGRKKESFFYKKLQHIKIIFLSFFLSFSSCQFSRHFTDPRLCISPFPSFSVFLATFQLLQCVFLILHVFQFSHHIPGPTM